jgi:hypothetical protein
MDREQLRARIRIEIDKEYTPARLQADTLTYVAFGLFPPDLNMDSMLNDLYTEQVAGFYDPDTKDLVLIREESPSESPDLLDRLWSAIGVGSQPSEESKAILAHELAHALADQHFDLLSLHKNALPDDDASLALTGLIEGEAMVIMILSLLDETGQADFLATPPELLSTLMNLVLPLATTFAGGEAFSKAPPLIQETLLVPYTQGLQFCLHILQNGGWARLNEAFRNPPISSEQLLHPERYLANEQPLRYRFPSPPPAALLPLTSVKENTLGELALGILLDETLPARLTKEVANGWAGDTYRVYRRADASQPPLLLWLSAWDSPEEAIEAEHALRMHFLQSTPPAHVYRRGQTLSLIRGATDAERTEIAAWMGRASTETKTLPRRETAPKRPFPETPDPRLAEAPRRSDGADIPVEPPGVRSVLEGMGVVDTALVETGEGFADRLCACADDDCIGEVLAENNAWFESIREDSLSTLDADRLKRAANRLLRCVERGPRARSAAP